MIFLIHTRTNYDNIDWSCLGYRYSDSILDVDNGNANMGRMEWGSVILVDHARH